MMTTKLGVKVDINRFLVTMCVISKPYHHLDLITSKTLPVNPCEFGACLLTSFVLMILYSILTIFNYYVTLANIVQVSLM